MRNALIALSMAVGATLSTPAVSQVSFGVSLPGVSIGVNVPVYPELVPVPGYPVYYAREWTRIISSRRDVLALPERQLVCELLVQRP